MGKRPRPIDNAASNVPVANRGNAEKNVKNESKKIPVSKQGKKELKDIDFDELIGMTSADVSKVQGEVSSTRQKAEKPGKKAMKKPVETDSESDDDDAPMDLTSYKQSLSRLEEKDPEFFKYLKNNDANLLAFGDEDEDEDEGENVDENVVEEAEEMEEEGDADEVGQEEDDGDGDHEGPSRRVPTELTLPMYEKMLQTASVAHSSSSGLTERQLGNMVHAFRAAVCMGDISDALAQLGWGQVKQIKGGRKQHKSTPLGVFDRGKSRVSQASLTEETQETIAASSSKEISQSLRFSVKSNKVYMKVVLVSLQMIPKYIHAMVNKHQPQQSRKKGADADVDPSLSSVMDTGKKLATYTNWKKLKPILRSFLSSTLILLSNVIDLSIQLYILRTCRSIVPFFTEYHSFARKWIKLLLTILAKNIQEKREGDGSANAASTTTTSNGMSVQTVAFLRLYQSALVLPYPMIDHVLKGTYQLFIRSSKFVSELTYRHLSFLSNCFLELCNIDFNSTYRHAFVYIRELAMQLRNALITHTDEARKVVCSWQFLQACKLWGMVLCAHSKPRGGAGHADQVDTIQQLVYPYVQVLLGVIKMINANNTRLIPLRLHLVSHLVTCMWEITSVYSNSNVHVVIPIFPCLTDILHSQLVISKPKAAASSSSGGISPVQLMWTVKVSQSVAETREYQEAVVQRTIDLILEAAQALYCNPAFPELTIPLVHSLKHSLKNMHSSNWRNRIKSILEAVQIQSDVVMKKRVSYFQSLSVYTKASAGVPVPAFMEHEFKQLYDNRTAAKQRTNAALMDAIDERLRQDAAANSGQDDAARKRKKRVKKGVQDEDEEDGSDDDDEGMDEKEDGEDVLEDGFDGEEEYDDDDDDDDGSVEVFEPGVTKKLPSFLNPKNGKQSLNLSGNGKGDVVEDLRLSDLDDDDEE
jgi:nucleolar complex protein 2